MTVPLPAIGLLAALSTGPAPDGGSAAFIKVVEDPAATIPDTRKALQELGEIREPRAVVPLFKLLFQQRQGRTLEAETSFALFQIGPAAADVLLRVARRQDSELLAWGTANHLPETFLLTEAVGLLGDLGDLRGQAPLIELLRYENPNKELELAIRRHAAKALGRLHSRAAVAPIAALVITPNMQARHEFVRALILIGGRDGLPALQRAATEGEWEVRKIAMDGFTMLGDGREQAAYKKILLHEAEVITSDCRAHPNYDGCGDQTALLDRMLSRIRAYAKRLDAAAWCKQDPACWTERLQDRDPDVRGRAVLELARRSSTKALDSLFAAAGDGDTAVQMTALQCLEWLLANDAKACSQSQRHLPALEAELAGGQGTVAGARLEAPLRRLIYRIQTAGPDRGMDLVQRHKVRR
jgi:HEAT repeat protein